MIVISKSPRRNHQMVVFHNTDAVGKKASITRHLPIDESRPCIQRKWLGKAAAKGNLR
jgi:hypothetical protein